MGRRAKGEGSIFRRKDGIYQADHTIGRDPYGRQLRKSVYGKTKAEVKEKLDQLKKLYPPGHPNGADLTVDTYIQNWLKEKKREIKPHTVNDYEYLLAREVLPRIGHIKLRELCPLDIQAMRSDIADKKSVQRANKARRILSAALNQAVLLQLISYNPVIAVKPYRETKEEKKPWPPQEARRFMKKAREHRLYALFYLAMETGLRRGEILGLRWQDIKGSYLRVNQTLLEQRGAVFVSTPKTKKSRRRIALTPTAVRILQEHKRRQAAEKARFQGVWPNNDYVFTTGVGTPISPRNLCRTLHSLLKKAGLKRIRFHDLRHWHSSVAIRQGFNAPELADRLGHTNPSFTLDVYTHLFEDQEERKPVPIDKLVDDDDDDEEI